jgi:hypothetical protein
VTHAFRFAVLVLFVDASESSDLETATLRRARTIVAMRSPLHQLVSVASILAAMHSAPSVSAADPPNASETMSALDVVDRAISVSGRARREILLRSRAPLERTVDSALLVVQPAPMSEPTPTKGIDLKIAGLDIGAAKSPATVSSKSQVEPPPRPRWSDSRNATSNGLSLDEVSEFGWLVGALGVGVGAYLLVTSDKKSGAETTIGTDFFSKGAGLRVRRRF